MKNTILLLMLTVITAISYGQTFHNADSTCPYRYANITYTDSGKQLYSRPMKWACNPTDFRDTIRGCATENYLYYLDGSQFSNVLGTQFRGATYNTWSNDSDLYRIVANDWAVRKIYIIFLP